MAKKTGKPKPGDVDAILEWAEEAIAFKRGARVAADEAVAYAERALGFRPRERNAILLTKEARLALVECESHASRAKDRRWAVESLAPPLVCPRIHADRARADADRGPRNLAASRSVGRVSQPLTSGTETRGVETRGLETRGTAKGGRRHA